MNEYKVEFFITSDERQDIKLTSLNEKYKEQWKRNIEEDALTEYYNRKIKIINVKN